MKWGLYKISSTSCAGVSPRTNDKELPSASIASPPSSARAGNQPKTVLREATSTWPCSQFIVEVKLVGLCRQSEGYAVSRTTTPEAADFKKRKRSCAWLYYWSFFSSLTDWLSSRRLETFPTIYLAHRVRKRYHRHACRRSCPTT